MQLLYEGVPIYTFWEPVPLVEALVVEEGHILGVGSREELKARYPGAKRIWLEGGAVVPAFNDCHCHILSLGLDLGKADLRECRSIPEIQAKLREWAQQHPEAPWILGRAYDPHRLEERRHPTRYELDAVSTERPIYVHHVSKHGAVVNSVALKRAGITRETPDPQGGIIERGPGGEPTGVLAESAMGLVSKQIPKPTEEEMVAAIERAAHEMARRGILAASDAGTGWLHLESEWRAYARALERGAPLRITLMPLFEAAERTGWLTQRQTIPSLHPDLRMGAIKLFADGAFTLRTAALREPYEDTQTTGRLMGEPEELFQRILAVHRNGWQCAVHAIGDRAIDVVLEGYQLAQKEQPRAQPRHRIEHCMLMHEDSLQKMHELGVVAVTQPEFLWWLGPTYQKGLGKRAEYLMPYQRWLKSGIKVAFSSDQPVVPGDPILGWRSAVTRRSQEGSLFGAEERLDPLTALHLFTVGGAYATFDEEIGQLAPGKRALFIVLSHPPEQIAEEEMQVVFWSYR